MTAEADDYLAVLKASYDYEPQSEDEIAIKENQILFLKERVDDDWWKVKVRGETQDEDSPVGLVPAAYVEQADHNSTVKALYDYEANAPGELTISEDEILLAFDTEEDWLLVQSTKEGGKAGYIPVTYVEAQGDEEEDAKPSAPQIVVPDSPPRPTSTYVDPEDRVASTKANADDIKTWPVSEVDKKGKKTKGTLGIGNGAVFFASESSKAAVQKWQTVDITTISIEKSKHVHFDVEGPNPTSLHFHAGSKDNAEAITAKLESSKALSAPSRATSPQAEEPPRRAMPPPLSVTDKGKPTVHFSPASPVVIPPREASVDYEEAPEPEVDEESDGETAVALYDFTADGDDELSVREGEHLIVLEKDGDEWWKCRTTDGREGVVPASYVELNEAAGGTSAARAPVHDDEDEEAANAAREAESRADAEAEAQAAEAARRDREQQEKERKKQDAQRRAKAAAAAAEAERIKRKEASAAAAARAEASSPPATARSPPNDNKKSPENGSASSSRTSTDVSRPPPDRVRIWHDRTGQFRVDAAFLGFSNGKLRLHKTNGVIVEVPSAKMSVEDMRYVEKMTRKAKPAPTRVISDDDIPLAVQHPGAVNGKSPSRQATQPPKRPTVDWFDFFLSAGCDMDDCTRYAASFERDKIDEAILPDITDATMRSLGLREGDIIRVTKAISNRKPQAKKNGANEQMLRDEELAKQLQAEENAGHKAAPSLFTGPGGTLKANVRRGRPQPSKSLPGTVDINAIGTASDQIQRTSSPQIMSPDNARPASTPVQPPPRSTSALAASSGFDDDAWTVRTKTASPAPAAAARAPSAPPAAPLPPAAVTSPAPQPTPTTTAAQPAVSPGSAQTTESDIFEQLARLSELRKNTPNPPQPSAPTPPAVVASPVGFQSGMGMSGSPAPMGQFVQSQQTGFVPQQQQQSYNGPRGPFAPVPSNQSLLQPLIPTQTGFNSFIPTRPNNNASPFQNPPLQPSFLSSQPTGFQAPQPTGFQPSQPMMSQATGMPFGGMNSYTTGGGFGQVSSNPTGFNPSFNQQFGNGMSSPPPVPPIPSSVSNNTNPANIFAQMKSGTFAADEPNPQQANYDALRPNPLTAQATGWGGFQNQGPYYR